MIVSGPAAKTGRGLQRVALARKVWIAFEQPEHKQGQHTDNAIAFRSESLTTSRRGWQRDFPVDTRHKSSRWRTVVKLFSLDLWS